ncbi:phospholipid-transporting ATPase ABCA3-like [Musca vetustissima]|uniref:phospholipid-transporting ATPase ABCA3-like n=1 Tax=Musca vetustissima TaxID=27455 RepID=UPI002AB62EF3|nr:phospholipid-transporting ATPase ABCA3-like [Musca vetustissima]
MLIVVFYTTIVINPAVNSRDSMMELEEAQRTHFYENCSDIYDLTALRHLKGLSKKRLRYGLLYGPPTNFTTHVVEETRKALKIRNIFPVQTEKSLLNHFHEDHYLAGIFFHNLSNRDNNLEPGGVPVRLSATLSFPSEFRTSEHPDIFPSLWLTRCTGVLDHLDTDHLRHTDLYLREGFLQLQHRLFIEWLKLLINSADSEEDLHSKGLLPKITIRSFQHRTDQEPCYVEGSSNIIWFLYYFTFFVPFLRVIRKFSQEQEENIPAHHLIYGYEPGHLRAAHFLISFCHFFLLGLIIVAILTIEWTSIEKYHIFRRINPAILLLFIILYITILLIYAMLVTTVFVNSANCVLFGAAMWLGSYGLFSLVMDTSEKFSIALVISLLIFFNNMYPYGMRLMKEAEDQLDYQEIWSLIYIQVTYIFMLLFVLALADLLRPGRYVRRRYFNYLGIPYVCHIWLRRRRGVHDNSMELRRRTTMSSAMVVVGPYPSCQNLECGPVMGQEVLYLKNINTYRDRIRNIQQLKKLTLRFYKNEISVILGPHGTGKTRLISILAGWCKPFKGNIYFNGDFDIYENCYNYHDIIDVSMPNNPLWPALTVQETLWYFCAIKQKPRGKEDLEMEIKKWLKVLGEHLPNGSLTFVRDLSFSQKRLLALCSALSGDRVIILLDNPTLHMTLKEQLPYWEILRQEKENRAIIITTFSINEADAIGDRIGILSDGNLLAWGTPFFLKTRFGSGFDLILIKRPDYPNRPITDLISQYIPNTIPTSEIGDQLLYKLPPDKRNLYQKLLISLEKQSQELGISTIRLGGSELKEIYMKLGMANSAESMDIAELQQFGEIFKFTKKSRVNQKLNTTKQQINAMLYKKMIHQAPNIIPIIMIFVVFLLILLINEMTKLLRIPSTQNEGIHLGLPRNATERDFLSQFDNCSFVEVAEIQTADYQLKLNNKPKYFLFKRFECGQGPYQEDLLSDTGIYDKFGAVEYQGPSRQDMVLWINEKIFHTAAISLNLAHNLILSNIFPNRSDILTTIINKPKIIPLHININLIDNQVSHLRLALTMGVIMPITMSCFIVGLVEERTNHLLTLQRIAGVKLSIYWLIGILWDFGTFFAFSIIYFLVMLVSTIEGFGTMAKLLILLLLNVHGLSALCFIYLLSLFMPRSRYRAFLIAIVVQLVLGLCTYVFYWDVAETSSTFYYLLSLSPTFSLLDGISNIYTENKEHEYCRERCQDIPGCYTENMCSLIPNCCADNFFKWSSPGILPSLSFMLLSGVLSSLLYFLINIYRNEKLHSGTPRIKQMGSVCFPYEDDEVMTEKVRISNMDSNGCRKYQLLADQIEQQLPRHGLRLNTISMALEGSTCVALYGSHHSGKSHLIRQLLGTEPMRFGELYICGHDCRYETRDAYQAVGYCPQDRGLCNSFTPRQLMTLFLMIRGISEPAASQKIRTVSQVLQLRRYMRMRICYVPMEVRRKLNIAMSLILCNGILILDEPTRGMSAMDRQLIITILRKMRSIGHTLLISSSDSLECHQLADKLFVLQNGEALAMGSPTYVGNKYGKGFYLEVRLLLDGNTTEKIEENLEKDIENMQTYVNFLHGESKLVNQYRNTLKYYIPLLNVQYSYLFGSLEKNRHRLNISEYTIGQESLLMILNKIVTTRNLNESIRKKLKFEQNRNVE